MDSRTIIDAVTSVTKRWTKQRKSEERDLSRASRRRDALVRARRVTVKDAAWRTMEAAYLNASSGGGYPAQARQVMYAARGAIQDLTGRILDDKHYTQKLLPDYLAEHPEETAAWDVVFDARGHFAEPHTRVIVPLGTIDVRNYLANMAAHAQNGLGLCMPEIQAAFPTCGPEHRFKAVLFIEKEGFLPLFKAVRLAERYDIAIMSTKGMSVIAARALVDSLCGQYGIPLLVLHDFDKAGFSILSTLKRNTRRYTFKNDIQVIDMGLRLVDVEEWELQSEDVVYSKADPTSNLLKNGATKREVAFLCDGRNGTGPGYRGRRVELNAFSSADLVEWIENKLQEHGIEKVIPDASTLEVAYRRATEIAIINQRMKAIAEEVHQQAMQAAVPEDLAEKVVAMLEDNPAMAWDSAIADLVREENLSPP
jgi:hypothetical protein